MDPSAVSPGGAPDLGALLQEARTASELSIRAAARIAGLSEARWRQLEAGYELRDGNRLPVNPKPSTVIQAAEAVHLDARAALDAAGFADVDPGQYREAGSDQQDGVVDQSFWVKFGWGISTLRNDAGISQVDLARALAERGLPYHQATVYKVEAGVRKVPVNELVPLADALGVTVDMLLGRAPDDQPSAPATIDSLIYRVRSASVTELQRLRDVVETALAIRTEEA